ncbi:hypothetical protein [Streptomyces boninensis]|uniref:hypothetical protein n=1 Tax=Streptomyces boninensis TaxID=2039455 RepID=UPI003B210E9E
MVRHTVQAAATTAIATLVLTGCGTGDSGQADDKIEGAKSSPAKTTAPPSTAPGEPEIKLPSSMKLVFESWKSDDPKEQAVLDSGAQAERATYEALTQNPANPDSKFVAIYHMKGTGAWSDVQKYIGGFKKAGATVKGTTRYLPPKVAVKGNRASIVFCADESKVASLERQSGKVLSAAKPNSYTRYSEGLQRNDNVWQVVSVASKEGGCDSRGVTQ